MTGSDGSQTGVASFQGAFTAISETGDNLFLLQRQSDCSINLLNVTSATNGTSVSFNVTSNTPHYERTLHQLASLNTTAGAYPHGCAEKNTGISTRSGVYVGVAKGAATSQRRSSRTTAAPPFAPVFTQASLRRFQLRDLPLERVRVDHRRPQWRWQRRLNRGQRLSHSAFVSVMLGNADGTFQSPVDYAIAGNMSVAAVVDDLNGDGKLDIIAVSDDQPSLSSLARAMAPSTPRELSAPCPRHSTHFHAHLGLITADVNNDGKKDLICSDGLVLLGNGTALQRRLLHLPSPTSPPPQPRPRPGRGDSTTMAIWTRPQ